MAGYKRHDKPKEPARRMEFTLECRKFNRAWKSTCWSDGTKDYWLPKKETLIRDERGGVDEPKPGQAYTVSIPVWLSEAEGLI